MAGRGYRDRCDISGVRQPDTVTTKDAKITQNSVVVFFATFVVL